MCKDSKKPSQGSLTKEDFMVHVTMGICSVEFHHDLRRHIYMQRNICIMFISCICISLHMAYVNNYETMCNIHYTPEI